MTWAEVIESPYLKDLPFKIELNEWGQIVMSPAANNHGCFQTSIVEILLKQQTEGKPSVECSVQTRKNVKVPDVVWMSDTFIRKHSAGLILDTPLENAPELCVEIVSPSNTRAELKEKRDLYFERGAREVWQCSEQGEIKFYGPKGELTRSAPFPKFPKRVKAI
ncbi:MAG TPA: Uma2 family endonuclease [Planctomycetota bacterium]|nr:Uma2 family endonuclease [Planctomycetota bacterium]